MSFLSAIARRAPILAFAFSLPIFGGSPPAELEKQINKTLGAPMTLSDFQKIYADILPLGSIEVIPSKSRAPGFYIMLKNLAGINVGHVELRFRRHKNAPSIFIEKVFLQDRAFRGYGLASRLLRANVNLLQSATSDRRAAILLRAWTGPSLFGGYIWAPYGFDYDDKVKGQQLHRKFGSWLERTYGDQGAQELTSAELEGIKFSAEKWQHPWEMALFDITPTIGRSIGKFNGKLGKEFMGTAEEHVIWNGVLYVNREAELGMTQFRAYSQKVLERSCAALLAHKTFEPQIRIHRIEKSLNK